MAVTKTVSYEDADRTVYHCEETDDAGNILGDWEETTWKPGSPGATQQENRGSLDSLRATLTALAQGTQTATQADLNMMLARFVLLLDAAQRGDNSTVI